MNVHAVSGGTVNSQLTRISNHRTTDLSRQGKTPSPIMQSGRQNGVSLQNLEEAMESTSEKAREAGQRKNPTASIKSKINLYA